MDLDYFCLQAWGEGETDKVTISTTRAVLPAMPLISGISPSPPSCESHTYNPETSPHKGCDSQGLVIWCQYQCICSPLKINQWVDGITKALWILKQLVLVVFFVFFFVCFGVLSLWNLTVFLPLLHGWFSIFSTNRGLGKQMLLKIQKYSHKERRNWHWLSTLCVLGSLCTISVNQHRRSEVTRYPILQRNWDSRS